MGNLDKVIKKMLMTKPFHHNGFEYEFLSVELDDEGWSYDIVVNVNLPEKIQSYATPVFSGYIHEILANMWKYVDTSFSYSEKILVNGKEPINGGVFISPEKQKEVLLAMREDVRHVKLRTAIGSLEFDVYWKPMNKFYQLDDVYIDFNFDINISRFTLDGHYAKPNLKIADDVAGAILNVMYDTDYLRDKINNVIYDVMGNEIDITDIDDLYYQVRFYIVKMDGFEINQKWGNHYDLEPDMFT